MFTWAQQVNDSSHLPQSWSWVDLVTSEFWISSSGSALYRSILGTSLGVATDWSGQNLHSVEVRPWGRQRKSQRLITRASVSRKGCCFLNSNSCCYVGRSLEPSTQILQFRLCWFYTVCPHRAKHFCKHGSPEAQPGKWLPLFWFYLLWSAEPRIVPGIKQDLNKYTSYEWTAFSDA